MMKLGVFITISLAITLPWFIAPGYLFFLDWSGVPTPYIGLDPTGGISGMPIQIIWALLARILGSAFAQKFLIFFMLTLSGASTFVLTKHLTKHTLASTIAGIFIMTNAFVFTRIQMGHIYLLYAYALTPYAIYAILNFLKKPTTRNAVIASLASCIVILLSIHHIILFPIITGIIIWSMNIKQNIPLKQYAILVMPFIAVISIILFTTYANPASSFKTISTQNFSVFAPQVQCSNSVLVDTVFLAVNWKSSESLASPCSNDVFYATNSALIAIMLIASWRNKKLLVGVIVLITLTLTPIIPAMRDSAKYIADLALLEAILLAYGVVIISKKIKNSSIIILCITILAGYPIYLGLSHTIVPKNYPESWYSENNYFATLLNKPTVLFLPWHLYMPFDFTNNTTIGNSAKLFFIHAKIIQSNDAELQKPEALTVESAQQKLQQLIQQYHPNYIMLAQGSPEEQIYQQALNAFPHFNQQYSNTGLTV
ncbi:MAG: hypothetical protein ABIP54_00020, partial [Candidatus Andersenbacteria bacterium]